MQKGSTLILRGVILLLGLIVLALCIFALPQFILSEFDGDFDYGPIFIGMYIPAIPFFIALYQTWKLLNNIDRNVVFSKESVNSLNIVKKCGWAISLMYLLGMPYIFYVADRDNAPGLAALGFVIIGASAVIATSAAVLEKLLANVVSIKAENDLTV